MSEVGLSLAFWVIAAIVVVAALGVVLLGNLTHAVLSLILTFCGVAALYVTLRADFLAAVQVLIYAGAVSVLVIFAIMFTQNPARGNPSNRLYLPALALSFTLFVVIVGIVLGLTEWRQSPEVALEPMTPVTHIADLLFNRFVLPFEMASVLLLAAMIGAIVLTKEG